MRVVAYRRVSLEKQADEGIGLEAQNRSLEAWCRSNGATLAAVHQDICTGTREIPDRPGLMAALAALEPGGALLVSRRDRLARDVLLACIIERVVKRIDCRILSAAGEGTESDEPTAVLMRRILDAYSEYERGLIGARTKDALAALRALGRRVGGVPYGFCCDVLSGYLRADPGEAETVALALRLRREGFSLRQIGQELEHRGRRPRSGGRWHPQQIARIVRQVHDPPGM